jgi:ABC-type proline/glycine betaine transport system ATPase subunit
MENVRYARLDATDEDVIEACKAAAVHDKIMSFPDQYKSKVGERGVKLSGGELQRVAIARVILKNPKIVLLDEATSAVDSSIEAQIQAAFKKLSAGRTTFVVAHRLSTIMEADLILVIDHGEIIERGTHEELISHGKKYFELWSKQTAGKGSNVVSKANSFLDIPDDIHPAMTNDLPLATYTEELKKAFVDEKDDDEEGRLSQVDGACESKCKPATGDEESNGCLGLSKIIKKNRDDKAHESGSSSSRSSNNDDGAPIRMISARPTFGTTASVPESQLSAPRSAFDESQGSTVHPTSSMLVQPPDSRGDTAPATRTSSNLSHLPPANGVPKVTIESPKSTSSSSSTSSPSPKSKDSYQSSRDYVDHKPVEERKPTGYPKDMPGVGNDTSTSSESSKNSAEPPQENVLQQNHDASSSKCSQSTSRGSGRGQQEGSGSASSQAFDTPEEE